MGTIGRNVQLGLLPYPLCNRNGKYCSDNSDGGGAAANVLGWLSDPNSPPPLRDA